MKKQDLLDFEIARDMKWKKTYNSELFEKNVGMLDFVILDIDLACNRYCLWSWDYSTHVLRYAVVFWKKLLLLDFFFVVMKYTVFI